MSMGVPVVSTTVGIEGLEAIVGQHMVIGDSAPDLVEAIVRLFHDGAEADAIRQNARVLVEEKYSWNIIRRKLLEAYPSLGATRQEVMRRIGV
jgi:glycosyltransferase involved in cell wall biosynthesis